MTIDDFWRLPFLEEYYFMFCISAFFLCEYKSYILTWSLSFKQKNKKDTFTKNTSTSVCPFLKRNIKLIYHFKMLNFCVVAPLPVVTWLVLYWVSAKCPALCGPCHCVQPPNTEIMAIKAEIYKMTVCTLKLKPLQTNH